MTATLRIALIDDEALIRTGFAAIIGAEPDLEVVAQGADGVDALTIARSGKADVLLMDVRMPTVDGIQATERIVAELDAPPKILVVTTFDNDDYVWQALRAGADGFLLKRTRVEDLLAAVRLVARTDALLFPEAVRRLAAAAPTRKAPKGIGDLSDREREVLVLAAKGLSNQEIAGTLFLGRETVKTHLSGVYAKLGVRDRTQAVIAAYEGGLV
ncbi:response regulator [Glycomyces algeriensis]|uniref:DNA-binding response regulator n=1 Tax=Glycomyces algeriensis TaxID=256037 RepID=A0A9W6GCD6_9ACTN|nr:response regulator transcription factor [Glycomyces algeriensis]MDA1365783.1 response regulator transcription factor [Glycomyces algeriensis]MDR7351472.1 DNA-binding NarL/FixJ family response regulator [Glycomyces algeriensis]GLI44193.1 DNA-binding response regulator [Glycomyces algeriensis]